MHGVENFLSNTLYKTKASRLNMTDLLAFVHLYNIVHQSDEGG